MPGPGPQRASSALRVVAIGGGTGLSTLLRGLKRYVQAPPGTLASSPAGPPPNTATPGLLSGITLQDLAAIVTVTDDGGSSGRLREDFQMLPPGDIRNCIVAVCEDEHLLSRLFQYRFSQGDLQGHSLGNLFLAALTDITGDFAQAVQMSSQILAARGHIYPATTANVHLIAKMDDGSFAHGETRITASKHRIVELMLDPPTAEPLPETLDAISRADLITMGPGSLYTSLITNLLVRGIPQALAQSRATRVYIGNLMTQANESLGLTASQHIQQIVSHAGGARLFDYALINTAPLTPALLDKYAREGQSPIQADLDRIQNMGITPIPGDFLHEGSLLRHDADKVTAALLNLALKS